MDIVKKAWGEERIITNQREYCGKILVVNRGAGSSVHVHRRKKETFYCLQGDVVLRLWGVVESKEYQRVRLIPQAHSVTVNSGTWHQFHALQDSQLLEVSTHDDAADTERRTQSYGAGDEPPESIRHLLNTEGGIT